MIQPAPSPVGEQLKQWRQRRRWSQLDCALEAGISQRHLSFIESGRAGPSRGMVLRLAERLGVPLRERNAMLLAAGFAPVFAERALDDPALAPARAAIDAILAGHEPFPALSVDRHWTLIAASGDSGLQRLRAELLALPVSEPLAAGPDYGGVAIPLCLRTPMGELRFLSTITVFGTPVDITLSELALELFFPADTATADALRAMAQVD
jgi:transcriptional regulator with XRE-family HTH domain